jgi:hypothetical protein
MDSDGRPRLSERWPWALSQTPKNGMQAVAAKKCDDGWACFGLAADKRRFRTEKLSAFLCVYRWLKSMF